MSAGIVSALLADLLEPTPHPSTPANPAKAANPPMAEGRNRICEGLRKVANAQVAHLEEPQDSQEFAAFRNDGSSTAPGLQPRNSQVSQLSHGGALTSGSAGPDFAGNAWTDADIGAFLSRRARLLRWGWPEPDAEHLAGRLLTRDRERDDRASCIVCAHYRPGQCANHRPAGLFAPDVGRDLAGMLQRCPGFSDSGRAT